jgi:hypothetical protein
MRTSERDLAIEHHHRSSERDSPKEHHHLIDAPSIIESSTDDSSPSSLQSPGNIFSRPSYDIVFFVFFATNSHAYSYFFACLFIGKVKKMWKFLFCAPVPCLFLLFCLFVCWESEEKCESFYFVLQFGWPDTNQAVNRLPGFGAGF